MAVSTADAWPRPRTWRRIKIWMFLAARAVVVPILRLLIGFRIEGLENLPRRGPALMVANHLHNADPILLIAAFTRPILWMAKKEVFSVPIIRWIARQAGAFPVDRGKPDRSALRRAEMLLSEGMIVGLFPEGTRSITGAISVVHPGVAMIAVRTGVQIIPTAIWGTEVLPLNGRKGRRPGRGRPRVTVRIGKPFHLPSRAPGAARPSLETLTDLMMIEVAKLLPRQYRGIYADRVQSEALDESALPADTGAAAGH